MNRSLVSIEEAGRKLLAQRSFPTMTVAGIYGTEIKAESIDEAVDNAEAQGEKVLDCTVLGGRWVLVVAE